MKPTADQPKTKRTIRQKIFLGFLIVVAITLALLWLAQVVLFDLVYSNVRTNEVKTTARHVKLYLNEANFYKMLADAAATNDMCAEVISSDGSIAYDAENTGLCLLHSLTQSQRQELIAMVDSAALLSLTYDPITEEYEVNSLNGVLIGGSNILYIEKVTHNGETLYLLLDAAVSPVGTIKKASASFLITLSFVLVIVAVLLANFIAKLIAGPIGAISREAKNLARASYTPPDSHSAELDELNEALSTAAKDLKKVERQRTELIANLSHDLRTPLTLISGYAEMMRDLPSEVTEENLTTIVDETKRLTTLVNDMLDISLLENGQKPMQPAPFALTEAIDATVKQYRELTAKDGYSFTFTSGDSVTVIADRAMILQVVCNLLNNAMTYTGEDKTVTIEQIVNEDSVRIEVSDTGCGIEPDKLSLIWDRYYKVDAAHKRAARGTGLGLSIVRTVISLHGGRYGVRSTVGKGSTFWFELPIAPRPD